MALPFGLVDGSASPTVRNLRMTRCSSGNAAQHYGFPSIISSDHWNEIENTAKTRGQMTLTHLFRSEPGNYARLIASLLPKDISVETAAGEMDQNQIDDVIARIQERLLDVRAREARSVGLPEARAN